MFLLSPSSLPPLCPSQEISSILKELRRVQKQLEGRCGPDLGQARATSKAYSLILNWTL